MEKVVKDTLLPIYSVVRFKTWEQPLMKIRRFKTKETWEYIACYYPIGNISTEYNMFLIMNIYQR